ncbi:MAG: protein kinase [Tannerella sp.]|jgi:serine/threonine-protein kinase|nr:protein kinase [Tannerella sp.]
MKHLMPDIPDHTIVRKIGEGGMGAVYLAIDNMLQRQVAVKALKPDISQMDENMQRFQSEAVTLAKLRHPGITMLYNLVRSDAYWCMIMEYVEGETLEALLKQQGALPVEEVLRIAVRTLDSLQHAHDRGVIHRDLKPSNLMLSTDGEVKIMDFGIARIAGGSRLTRTGQAMGTPQYMSPEQVRGQEGNQASDIYSFGVVLYELLTGVTPFDSDSEFEIMQAHTNRKPVPPAALNPAIPAALNDAILKTLAKNPSQRFSGANDLKRCLQQIAVASAAHPSHSSTTFRLQLPKMPALPKILQGMDRRYASSAAFLFVSLLAALLVIFHNSTPELPEMPPEEQISKEQKRSLEVEPNVNMDDILGKQRPAEQPVFSPSGGAVVPPSGGTSAGQEKFKPAIPPVKDTGNKPSAKPVPEKKKESDRKKPTEKPSQDVAEKTKTAPPEETELPAEVKPDPPKPPSTTLSRKIVVFRGTPVEIALDAPCDYDKATDRMRVTLSVVKAVECSGVTVITVGSKAYALLHRNTGRRELELEMVEVESVTGRKLKSLHTTYKASGFAKGTTFKMNLEYDRLGQ